MTTHTTERVKEAGRLCDVAAGMPLDKAAIAAIITETFVNGMKAQELLTAGNNAPQQA